MNKIFRLLAVFSLVMSVSAFAGVNPSSSFSEIAKAKEYSIDWPMIQADGVIVTINGYCYDSSTDSLKLKSPVTVCTKYKYPTFPSQRRDVFGNFVSRGEPVCVATKTYTPVTPRVYEFEECLEYKQRKDERICVKTAPAVGEHELSREIDILKKSGGHDNDYKVHAFSKEYKIEDCK